MESKWTWMKHSWSGLAGGPWKRIRQNDSVARNPKNLASEQSSMGFERLNQTRRVGPPYSWSGCSPQHLYLQIVLDHDNLEEHTVLQSTWKLVWRRGYYSRSVFSQLGPQPENQPHLEPSMVTDRGTNSRSLHQWSTQFKLLKVDQDSFWTLIQAIPYRCTLGVDNRLTSSR